MKFVILFIITTLCFSCSRTRLQPCCRFNPGLEGFERYKTIKLRQNPISNIAIYTTDKYLILVHKDDILKSIRSYVTNPSDYNENDTLDLNSLIFDNRHYLTKAIVREIDKKKVIILDKETGERIEKIRRRKFNFQTAPRIGRGGIEYIDPKKDHVILRLTFWVS